MDDDRPVEPLRHVPRLQIRRRDAPLPYFMQLAGNHETVREADRRAALVHLVGDQVCGDLYLVGCVDGHILNILSLIEARRPSRRSLV